MYDVLALRRAHPSDIVCATLIDDNMVVMSACDALVRMEVATVVPFIGRKKSTALNITPGGNPCVVDSYTKGNLVLSPLAIGS